MSHADHVSTSEPLVMPTPELRVLEARFTAARQARDAITGDVLASYARVHDQMLNAQAALYMAFAEHLQQTRPLATPPLA
ncbi:hypothetical protein VDF70_11900 [Xanthomonas campestris pv. raphani]|uniref:hypothetical protein n=1 Tax=Xanthomonas campestris TaxID=339 RepID=UPI002B22BC32|nr:hypothetical protein [Xanthomonas campestris]MEA9759755.1 hypothetical protein [Xanthomonas campestris pv. raphani]